MPKIPLEPPPLLMSTASYYTSQSKSIYTQKQHDALFGKAIPRHVALIMDGNRRWAKRQCRSWNIPQWLSHIPNLAQGHQAGAAILHGIVRAAQELSIKVLTVYGFSTENWLRPPLEVETLISICETYLLHYQKSMVEEGIKLSTIGDLTPFPLSLRSAVASTSQATERGTGLNLVIALNYGARDEIKRAMQKMARDILQGDLLPEEITEERIAKNLDTASWPELDLLIRTSGEMRLSNFLLWQSAYAEIHITQDLWPDFSPQHLYDAVWTFSQRERRQGT